MPHHGYEVSWAMFCKLGLEIRAKLNRSELEMSVAANNYKFTGLPRYKQTLARSESELCIAKTTIEQHQRNCAVCRGAAENSVPEWWAKEFV